MAGASGASSSSRVKALLISRKFVLHLFADLLPDAGEEVQHQRIADLGAEGWRARESKRDDAHAVGAQEHSLFRIHERGFQEN